MVMIYMKQLLYCKYSGNVNSSHPGNMASSLSSLLSHKDIFKTHECTENSTVTLLCPSPSSNSHCLSAILVFSIPTLFLR